jgi:hypothetical protein
VGIVVRLESGTYGRDRGVVEVVQGGRVASPGAVRVRECAGGTMRVAEVDQAVRAGLLSA